jgi:hypothetical protein
LSFFVILLHSLLCAALQCQHLELASKLLQLHGASLSTRVLLNSLPRIFQLQAWQLAEAVTALMEQRTGTKQQVGQHETGCGSSLCCACIAALYLGA